MNPVAKNIRKLRQQKNITQEELAERLHVTRQAVSNWENDKNQPDIEMLIRLAQAFDTDVNQLIYGILPQPYRRFQRRYVRAVVICIAVVITVLLLEIFLYPHIVEVRGRTYRLGPMFAYVFAARPIGFMAAGAALPSALSLWADTRLKKKARIAALVFGFAVAVMVIFMFLQMMLVIALPQVPRLLWFLPYAYMASEGTRIVMYLLLILGGAGLFLGLNK